MEVPSHVVCLISNHIVAYYSHVCATIAQVYHVSRLPLSIAGFVAILVVVVVVMCVCEEWEGIRKSFATCKEQILIISAPVTLFVTWIGLQIFADLLLSPHSKHKFHSQAYHCHPDEKNGSMLGQLWSDGMERIPSCDWAADIGAQLLWLSGF